MRSRREVVYGVGAAIAIAVFLGAVIAVNVWLIRLVDRCG